jgi:hypothetical protein
VTKHKFKIGQLVYFYPKGARRVDAAALASEIDRLVLRHEPGHGADSTGKWPPEPNDLCWALI